MKPRYRDYEDWKEFGDDYDDNWSGQKDKFKKRSSDDDWDEKDPIKDDGKSESDRRLLLANGS